MVLSGYLEKFAKYTKSWAKLFIKFDAGTCKLEYGEAEAKVKHSMTVVRIVRSSEVSAKIVAGSPDGASGTDALTCTASHTPAVGSWAGAECDACAPSFWGAQCDRRCPRNSTGCGGDGRRDDGVAGTSARVCETNRALDAEVGDGALAAEEGGEAVVPEGNRCP